MHCFIVFPVFSQALFHFYFSKLLCLERKIFLRPQPIKNLSQSWKSRTNCHKCTYVIMEGACNFCRLINTTGRCPQILIKVGSANLHKNSFVGSQVLPCWNKDWRAERHDKKNSLAEACKKVSFCEYCDELAAEYGGVATCHKCEKKWAAVIRDTET